MSLVLVLSLAAATPYEPPTDCRPGFRAPRPPAQPDQLVSAVHPIIVHFDAAAAVDETARAESALQALETSWDVQVDTLGFEPPVTPDAEGGPEFDVYMIEYSWGAAFVANDGWADAVVGDGLSSTSSYMVLDNRLPRAWVESYIAHEFNHACQYATDFTEFSLPIWEGTANAASGWTFGASARWDYNVDSWQQASNWPTLVASGAYTWYGGGVGYYFEYGAALWVMFLDEKYGTGDGTMGAELWANTANEGFGLEPDAVDAFAATAGTTVGDALNHLAVVRFLTGDDWDARGLIDAELWGPEMAVPAEPLDGGSLPWIDEDLLLQPFVTGQVFLDIDLDTLPPPTIDGDPWFDVKVTSPSALEAGVAILWWDDAGQVGDESTWGIDPSVSVPSAGLSRVVVAITNLGPTGWDGDDDPYQFADFRVSLTPRVEPAKPTTDPTDTGEPTVTDTGGTTNTPWPTETADSTDEPRGADEGSEEKSGGCGCVSGGGAGLFAAPQGLSRRRR